jgi:hypothetical protein
MRPRARRPRPARRAVLIVCEGQNTEPRYFERLAAVLGLAATVKVEIHGAPGCTDPQGLVDFAVATKNARAREARRDLTKAAFEDVWVVFDVEHSGNGRQSAIPGAVRAAVREGLSLAISNPSFEVWYILHDRPTPPGLTCSDDARPVLEKLVGRRLDKSRTSADALADWAMPLTATALAHGGRQDVLNGEPSQTSAHVPSATGTGAHHAVQSLVAMSGDAAGKRILGLPADD